jgi:hypothetical protein
MKNIVIFDLDGTLALIDHRRHLVEKQLAFEIWMKSLDPDVLIAYKAHFSATKLTMQFETNTNWKADWPAFYEGCDKDEPNIPVIKMYNMFATSSAWRTYIFSGRSESVRAKTWNWLDRYSVRRPLDLLMRPENDYTPDDQLKAKWLDELGAHNVLFTVDDRQKVVDMWRSRGLTCFQVAPGNF